MILRKHSRIFKDPSFADESWKGRMREASTLYQGLSRQPVTYQHLEKLLIAAGKRASVPSAPGKWARNIMNLRIQ